MSQETYSPPPEVLERLAQQELKSVPEYTHEHLMKELRTNGYEAFRLHMTTVRLAQFWDEYVPHHSIKHVGNGADERNRRDEEKRQRKAEQSAAPIN